MMKVFQKIHTVFKNPRSVPIRLLLTFSPLFSDRLYLRLLFPLKTGYSLNLNKPQTYNEKLQWLKLNYRKPSLSQMVDKFDAKDFIKSKVGDKYIVDNYGVWNSFDEIDFNLLPSQFVLKTTHDQGGVVICKDKRFFDFAKARTKLTKHLKRRHFYLSREWPYRSVKPRIIAEKLLIDNQKGDIWDYKFYCFNGEPRIMYISMGRQGNHVPFYFYDMNFKLLDLERPGHARNDFIIAKPNSWDKMINLAGTLSKNLPHVRVDFYEINDELYVGELTLFQGGGMMPFTPTKWDLILGNWLNLDFVINEKKFQK